MASFSSFSRYLRQPWPPRVPVETQRVEWVLAISRTFLAACGSLALYLDPGQPTRAAMYAYALFLGYAAYSLVLLVYLRFRRATSRRFTLLIHGADVVWPALITFFSEGPSSPFFPFFVFVVIAAAYRWGIWETIVTTCLSVTLVSTQAIVLSMGYVLDPMGIELDRVVMRSTYLLLTGVLLGYLAEQEKLFRAKAWVTARFMAKAQAGTGLRTSIRSVLSELIRIFEVRRVVLVFKEPQNGSVFRWEASAAPDGREPVLALSEIGPSQSEIYLLPAAGVAVYTISRSEGAGGAVLALDGSGRRSAQGECLSPPFAELHPFRYLVGVNLSLRDRGEARVFLLDPAARNLAEDDLRFFLELVRQVTGAVYNLYLWQRLRSQAVLVERARLARELHDGVIQSLVAAELEMEMLDLRAETAPVERRRHVARVREILRREIIELRELTEKKRPLDIAPSALVSFLATMVERFERETGIRTRFSSNLDEVKMSPRRRHELIRILQEALVNVRKHSGARNVEIRFEGRDNQWVLSIADDGRGFDFSGRVSRDHLERQSRGPLVIRERVRSMGGDLTVESLPGRGARLEITVPRILYD